MSLYNKILYITKSSTNFVYSKLLLWQKSNSETIQESNISIM